MSSNTLSTEDKLLLAAIDLMAEKGYNGVTTQEIANAAGLSEKTLFRRFGSKQNLLKMAFERYHYAEEITKLFKEKLVWDLETDLLLISRTYHEKMNRNRKLIMIAIKEEGNIPGIQEKTSKHPRQFLDVMTTYYKTMYAKGKLIQTDPELQALSFILLNYGAFMNNLDAQEIFPNVSLEKFINEIVQTFTRALTP